MASAPFPDLAETLGSLLRRPYARLQARLYERLAAEGFPEIRSAHSAVFRHLPTEGGRLTDLATAAGMTKQSMAYLVESLTDHGYLRIQADPADGRAKRVVFTAKGRRCIQAALRISQEMEHEAAAKMPKGSLAELRRLLGDLNEIV
ncbi:DNA-binding transcriptional regulator, MarR family [Prosthecobacter debontii]|uniref:DNA-binding transcriptional regulator, MarR family n=1 Tax=Prosthecobacter debontii TaxID=48467 RepID=A0A1T4YD32_9BACT|nr:MarR family winged helix-turn-helix transcriptional regulator [Prosthecobacter debontii]SKA99737.1 DNA-binding transcriptional regulator, MarR family [Prosthecobacter debontii]